MNEPISDLEEPQPKRFLSRWGGIYFSPKETFQEIGQAPRVLVPITALLVVGLLVFITLYSILDTESMAANQFDQMVAKGQMTPEQVERMAPVASVMINVQIFFVFVLGNVFYGLLIAGFVKLFSAIVGARNRFKAVFPSLSFPSWQPMWYITPPADGCLPQRILGHGSHESGVCRQLEPQRAAFELP